MALTQQNIPVQVIPPVFPNGWCPDALNPWQSLANAIASGLLITLPGQFSGLIQSDTEPVPNDRNKLWAKITTPTGPIERIYQYYNGLWVAPNPIPPAGGEGRLWFKDLMALQTYDGGDVSAPGDASGPMWEEITEMQARFPIGVGTTPAPYSTALALGANGGEEKHINDITEIAKHTHAIDVGTIASVTSTTRRGGKPTTDPFNGADAFQCEPAGGLPDGTTAAHNTMPLYRVVYFIRRTARLYYRAI